MTVLGRVSGGHKGRHSSPTTVVAPLCIARDHIVAVHENYERSKDPRSLDELYSYCIFTTAGKFIVYSEREFNSFLDCLWGSDDDESDHESSENEEEGDEVVEEPEPDFHATNQE